MKKLILIISIFILSGCTAGPSPQVEKKLDGWKNGSKTELILINGNPLRIESDGNGGDIYVYNFGFSAWYGENNMVYFYINKEGIIYHWRATGYYH